MGIIACGRLVNQSTGMEEEYRISVLGPDSLGKLLELHQTIIDRLERKEIFLGLSREEFRNILGGNGVTVGAWVGDTLAGFCSILFPGLGEDNLGYDLGLPQEDLEAVAHLEGAAVHPDFRGNSLQKGMTGICLDEALKIRRLRYICATVSPYNPASIDDLLTYKLLIRDIKPKYHGMLRYICSQDVNSREVIIKDSIVEIDSSDLDGQRKLLRDGLVGYEQFRQDGTTMIRFARTNK